MVVEMIDRIAATTQRKTVLILDNASIHKAKCVLDKRDQWRVQNLYLQFIPAYSPELNRIEILWKQIKHFRLPKEADKNNQTLRNSLDNIFEGIGTKYQLNFS